MNTGSISGGDAARDQTPLNLSRLRSFIGGIGQILAGRPREPALFDAVEPLLADLVAHDDWLPADCAIPGADTYRQYLLHCDSREAFSLVSFVWGPGQATPIHDHRTWGMIGMLCGSEVGQPWDRAADGRLVPGPARTLLPGDVDRVSPRIGDVHQVAHAAGDLAISIHLYGGNIGRIRRRAYQPDGTATEFVSGYSNASLPNIWHV